MTLLHSFTKVPQTYPQSGLAMDGAGNLYGAVVGAAYEVSASGVYTQFNLPRACANAQSVAGIPARGARAGNLYVVTRVVGNVPSESEVSGAIFKVNVASGTGQRRCMSFRGRRMKGFPQRVRGLPGRVCDPRQVW